MEVEQEIVAHPDIVECAVIPVASEHTEQEVMAVVAPLPEAVLDPAALIEFLAPRMGYFMVPRYVEVVDALPKTQTGKIRKYVLRERGLAPGKWDREAASRENERCIAGADIRLVPERTREGQTHVRRST